MKLNRNFLVILVIAIILILLSAPSLILVKKSEIKVDAHCSFNGIITNDSCNFYCEIKPYYKSNDKENGKINSRVVVFHSWWTAIYDETFTLNPNEIKTFSVELPKRNYNYTLSIALWDDKGRIGALDKARGIIC